MTEATRHKFRIYWWTNVGYRMQGSDIVELDQDELTEYEADDILSDNATTGNRKPRLENFFHRYNAGTFCLNFGVRKVVKLN